MTQMVVLDDDHQYTVDGKRVPSTTQIINAAHTFIDPWYLARGQKGHRAIELYIKGRLDESRLDPELRPYLEAYKLFKREAHHVSGIIDLKLGVKMPWHALQACAYRELWRNGVDVNGEPLRLTLQGQEVIGYHEIYGYAGKIDIIDVLPGSMPILAEAHDLYLKDTGKYKLEPIPSRDIRDHTQAFLTLVSAYHIRNKYQL